MNIIKKKSDPIDNYHHEAGKGSVPRPINHELYKTNYDRIFGPKEPRNENEKEEAGKTA